MSTHTHTNAILFLNILCPRWLDAEMQNPWTQRAERAPKSAPEVTQGSGPAGSSGTVRGPCRTQDDGYLPWKSSSNSPDSDPSWTDLRPTPLPTACGLEVT